MKTKNAVLLCLVISSLFLISGCSTVVQPTVVPPTPTMVATPLPIPTTTLAAPTSAPVVVPSPKPADTQLIPANCYREGLPTYINKETGICFAYPQRFAAGNENNGEPSIIGPALDKSADPLRATLTVQVRPTQVKNLADLISSYAAETKTSVEPKLPEATLDGEGAKILDPTRGRTNGRSVLLLFDSKLYVLLFNPSLKNTPAAQQTALWKQAEKDMQSLYEIVTSSFGFLGKPRQVLANDMLALAGSCAKNSKSIYIDTVSRYCVAIPPRFVIGQMNPGQRALWGPALDASADPLRATLLIDVKTLPAGSSLENQANEFAKANPGASVTRSATTIMGKPAVMFRNVPARGNSANILVMDGARLYNLYFQPDGIAKAKTDLDTLISTTVSSFGLLPSTN